MNEQINELEVLTAFVDAYAVTTDNGERRSILYVRYIGGHQLQHHGSGEWPRFDDGTIDSLRQQGLITFAGKDSFTPTALGQEVAAEYKRSNEACLVGDPAPIFTAVEEQSVAENILAWPVVLPVLAALRDYWVSGGLAQHGLAMKPLIEEVANEFRDLFLATVTMLVEGEYLEAAGCLSVLGVPGEIRLTTKARSVLDGWPGAAPSDLVQNLLAVLSERVRDEPDVEQRKRWQSLLDLVKELGVSVTSEVLAKVLTGGH